MDELQAVREALPRSSGPEPGVVAAGRLALSTEMAVAPGKEPARPWRARRLAVAGAFTVVLLVGLTVVQSIRVGSEHSLLPGAPVANAQQLGERAATAASEEPYVPPRPDQWIYVKFQTASHFDMNKWWEGGTGRETVEQWERIDGNAHASIDPAGKLQVWNSDPSPEDNGGPNINPANYATLPTDPAALLARMRTPYDNQIPGTGGDDGETFGQIAGMLANPLPPKLRATLFRILPTLDGVTLERNAVDAAGRHGLAFARDDDPYRDVIILDPRTYRYLGNYEYAIRDYRRSPKEGVLKKGTYLATIAQFAQGIVDKPGQRP